MRENQIVEELRIILKTRSMPGTTRNRICALIQQIETESIETEKKFHTDLLKEYDDFLLNSEKVIIERHIKNGKFKRARAMLDYAFSFYESAHMRSEMQQIEKAQAV